MKKKRNPDEKIVGRISKICKKCPLLILTAGIFTVAGALCAGSTFLYGNVQPQQYLKEHLLMPCWMQLIAGKDMDTESADQQVDSSSDHFASAVHSDAVGSSENASSETAKSTTEQAEKDNSGENEVQPIGETSFTTYEPVKIKSKYYEDAGKTAHTTTYPYREVGNDYFADAAFIGDSRMLGLHDYAGWQDSADFFCDNGFSVYKWAKDGEAVDQKNGKKVNLQKALSERKYGKIYLMVGMNDLGYGTTDLYTANMKKMLTMLRTVQPDAIICLMGNLHMAESKSDMTSVYNNISLNAKNVAMAMLADGVTTFYLDANPEFTDEKGFLKSELTFDGFHLYAKGYKQWADFIKKHGIMKQK